MVRSSRPLLREAVAKGFLLTVETSGEPESRAARVLVLWGTGLPAFEGVAASIATRYTMFSPNGTPVRATVSLNMSEPNGVKSKNSGTKESEKSDTKKSDCSPSQH